MRLYCCPVCPNCLVNSIESNAELGNLGRICSNTEVLPEIQRMLLCFVCCRRYHKSQPTNGIVHSIQHCSICTLYLPNAHCAKKPLTTMLTYPWKCTVLHCNHLGNTWKPLVLMTRHFDYWPRANKGNNQSVRSSAPVVSRCFPGGYNVKLYISRGRLAWWLLAFLCCGTCFITSQVISSLATLLASFSGLWDCGVLLKFSKITCY